MSYVRGKYAKAAVAMLDWLHDHGVKGGPVAQPSKRDPVIMVYGMTRSGIARLPVLCAGFEVKGTTKTPDYDRIPLHDKIRVPESGVR